MNLGQLIDILDLLPSNVEINAVDWCSWRGSYDQISLVPGNGTVGELLVKLESAVDGILYGYKGGEYPIGYDTIIGGFDFEGECTASFEGITLREGGIAFIATGDPW